jgi:hypothetical protein
MALQPLGTTANYAMCNLIPTPKLSFTNTGVGWALAHHRKR